MFGIRDTVWLIVYPLAMVSLFVSRRFGDRPQAVLLVALGTVVVLGSAWDLAVDPWAWDWMFLATGVLAIVLASTSLRPPRRRPAT